MNRRPLRSSTEPRQSTDDNPWLLRITYVVVALLFIGCWVLSFNALRQQQQRTAAVAPGGGSANTPTDSLTARLAATSVVDPTGAVAAASAITQATAAPSATARTANSIGTPVAAPAGTASVPTAGTTATVRPTPGPTASPSASATAETTYTVAAGDTLATIGKKYNVSVDDIALANQLKPPYPLKIGDRLIIPAR